MHYIKNDDGKIAISFLIFIGILITELALLSMSVMEFKKKINLTYLEKKNHYLAISTLHDINTVFNTINIIPAGISKEELYNLTSTRIFIKNSSQAKIYAVKTIETLYIISIIDTARCILVVPYKIKNSTLKLEEYYFL